MNKWRIHKENGRYIPQKKRFFFWEDIVIPKELLHSLRDDNCIFRCTEKYDDWYSCYYNYIYRCTEKYDGWCSCYYNYRPEFKSIEDAIYCIKEYDEYYKKKENDEKIENYYLDKNYEVK